MTTTLKRYSAIGGLFILGVSLMITYAFAFQGDVPYQAPIGTLNTCDADITASFNEGQVTLGGPATFVTVANSSPNEALAWTEYRVQQIGHDGTDPVLGPYVLTADPNRPTINSRIQANFPFQAFPATSTLRFHGTLAVAASGVYHSEEEVVIQNTNLDHWPHNNAVYSQVGTARFTNSCGGSIVLSGATVIVTAH